MPAISASAPGKVILFGEHAVVYGQPAIAAPVTQVRAKAVVTANPAEAPGEVRIVAADIRFNRMLADLPADHPLALAVTASAEMLGISRFPALRLEIHSTIPIAAGLGSGAAVSAAIARALSAFVGHPFGDDQVSHIAYRVDQKHHGNPSGIDNTVIAYAQPVFYVRGQPFERLCAPQPFTLVIGNTGIASPTRSAVADVRRRWEASPAELEALFAQIGAVALEARRAIESGQPAALGALMTTNHALLRQLDVSCGELDHLVEAALDAGAGGAKLCGGGRGGNMVALVSPEQAPAVANALMQAGAHNTITTTVSGAS